MVSTRLIIILLSTLLIAYFGSLIINMGPSPVSLRVAKVSFTESYHDNNQTYFEFNVAIEAWNERYRPSVIQHGRHCGVLPGVDSSDINLTRLQQPICAPYLRSESTKIRVGMTNFQHQLTFWVSGNLTSLPPGEYTFFSYPSTVADRGDLVVQVNDQGDWNQQTEIPSNWGIVNVWRTPLTWYIPAYLSLLSAVYSLFSEYFQFEFFTI